MSKEQPQEKAVMAFYSAWGSLLSSYLERNTLKLFRDKETYDITSFQNRASDYGETILIDYILKNEQEQIELQLEIVNNQYNIRFWAIYENPRKLLLESIVGSSNQVVNQNNNGFYFSFNPLSESTALTRHFVDACTNYSLFRRDPRIKHLEAYAEYGPKEKEQAIKLIKERMAEAGK